MLASFSTMKRASGQAVLASLLWIATGGSQAGVFDGQPIKVHDLHFGEVLYYFYQDQYFTAIVKLMAGQQMDLMPNHADEVDALLAGFYLNYGLHQEAERELRRLETKGVPLEIRNRAWIKLGQSRYKKGLYDDAIRALEEVKGPLEPEIQDEIQLQMGNLLIARGDYDEAITLLKKFPGGSENAVFAEYNLGIALYKNKQEILGAEHLDRVGLSSPSNEEASALKDKANIALGYALLMNDQGTKAKAYFQRVRINGPFSNKALLGLGWTNVMDGAYEAALTPWTALSKRKTTDASVYEALLAVPFALEQLKAYQQSLDAYQNAITKLNEDITHLGDTVKLIEGGHLWDTIIQNVSAVSIGEVDLKYIPENIDKRYIASVIATHAFHQTVRNLQDLLYLKENLQYWQTAMPTYSNMLELRRSAYEERLPELLPDEGIYKLTNMKDEAGLYREEMTRIERENDLKSLANDAERGMIEKLGNLKDFLVRQKHLLSQEEAKTFEEKYRLYAGLLEWEIGSTASPRRWKIKREIRALDQAIEKATERAKKMMHAKTIAPKGFEGYDSKIKSYGNKVESLDKRVDQLVQEQKTSMEKLIMDELSLLKQQLEGYLDQAQFALARLQDLAAGSGG